MSLLSSEVANRWLSARPSAQQSRSLGPRCVCVGTLSFGRTSTLTRAALGAGSERGRGGVGAGSGPVVSVCLHLEARAMGLLGRLRLSPRAVIDSKPPTPVRVRLSPVLCGAAARQVRAVTVISPPVSHPQRPARARPLGPPRREGELPM